MKKVIMLLLVMSVTAPVFADSFFKPEWKEFAPSGYSNISTEKRYWLAEKQYWSFRKANFEKHMAACNGVSRNLQEACYNKVISTEMRANDTRNSFTTLSIQAQSVFASYAPKYHHVDVNHF